MILRSTTARWLVAATSVLSSFTVTACGGGAQAADEPSAGELASVGKGFPKVTTVADEDRPEPASPKGPAAADAEKAGAEAVRAEPVKAGKAEAEEPADSEEAEPAAPPAPAEEEAAAAAEEESATQPSEEAAASGPAASARPQDAQCVQGKRLFFEDFESGDYDRWSSNTYLVSANEDSCFESEFSDALSVSGKQSHRTAIGCSAGQSHRIYGGVQFNGDQPVETYTNSGSGIDAPGGVVVSFWDYLDADNLGSGRWFSPFTVENACNWTSPVITLAVEDSSGQLNTSHITGNGGTVNYVKDRAPFPLRTWVRVTVYVNYHTGQFHVWQDGKPTTHATFTRNSQQICQFHWGLYASGPNDDIELYEDDISVWKLDQSPTDFDHEPWPVPAAADCK